MGGYRYVSGIVLVLLILGTAILTGCAEHGTPIKTLRREAITTTVDIYENEPYTQEKSRVVGENCVERHYSELNDSRFNISIGDAEWLGSKIPGETDYVRRTVQIYNGKNEVDTIWLDKIYLYDGVETKRSKHPMMFLIDPKSTRVLYVMWDTQYDPLKDVTIDFTNNTQELGIETKIVRTCFDETEKYNETNYRKVKSGEQEEVVDYKDILRVTLPKN